MILMAVLGAMAVVPALQYMLITGDELLTDKQRAWRDMKRISASFRPLPLQTRPPNKLQARRLSIAVDAHHSCRIHSSSCAMILAELYKTQVLDLPDL
jgi:hypothetical protein